jgi:hypothetical protein
LENGFVKTALLEGVAEFKKYSSEKKVVVVF